MYKPAHFQDAGFEELVAFMRNYSFATLIANGAEYPAATQIPLLVEEHDGELLLKGHLMRKTDHHRALEQHPQVLVLFSGPHTYISASLYENPASAGTWNYCSIQAKGLLSWLTQKETRYLLEALTNYYEPESSAAHFSKIPVAYIDQLIPAIQGFCIRVTDLQHTFKLSQNKTALEQARIIASLQESNHENDRLIAAAMQQRQPKATTNEPKSTQGSDS